MLDAERGHLLISFHLLSSVLWSSSPSSSCVWGHLLISSYLLSSVLALLPLLLLCVVVVDGQL